MKKYSVTIADHYERAITQSNIEAPSPLQAALTAMHGLEALDSATAPPNQQTISSALSRLDKTEPWTISVYPT